MRVVKTGRAIAKLGCAIVIGLAGGVGSANGAQVPDFNGDGFADLAIGAPLEDVGGAEAAGAVNVIYGSPSRLTAAGNQFWHQDRAGILGASEPADTFGDELAWGDFNGDGFDDLAIGTPLEDVGGTLDAGAVNVVYGSPSGLTAAGNQLWHQDSPGIEDGAEPFDLFGSSLASGDFNADGFDDLAIGTLLEDVGVTQNAGAVNVIYGSPTGLTAAGDQYWVQGQLTGEQEFDDYFAASLVSGDFNADGFADLAIGANLEDVGGTLDAGAVNVVYGSPSGLTAAGNQFWHQNSPGILDGSENGDHFGWSLASGDFNADGFADLAIGARLEDVGGTLNAGAVNVVYGSPSGLTAAGNQFWHQNSPGILDGSENRDLFGSSLASGDFNADGFADLAIGAPLEAVGGTLEAGAVNVIHGSPSGLTAAGNQIWHQDSPGILDFADEFDRLGMAVASGDFNTDGFDDLAIGAPLEDVDGASDAGAVNVVYGSPSGLTAAWNQFWHQNSPGILDGSASIEDFGAAL